MDLTSFVKNLENQGGDEVRYNTEVSEGKTITNISWELADDNYNMGSYVQTRNQWLL